jgi:hypothetical protein
MDFSDNHLDVQEFGSGKTVASHQNHRMDPEHCCALVRRAPGVVLPRRLNKGKTDRVQAKSHSQERNARIPYSIYCACKSLLALSHTLEDRDRSAVLAQFVRKPRKSRFSLFLIP